MSSSNLLSLLLPFFETLFVFLASRISKLIIRHIVPVGHFRVSNCSNELKDLGSDSNGLEPSLLFYDRLSAADFDLGTHEIQRSRKGMLR
jgi:hypothetical protein